MGQLLTGLEKVLGSILAFLYGIVPNYGVAIILLTILVNLLLFPLTLKQTRSTRAFQQIQPEIRRIQKEYKEEPETMQRELMKAQKEAGATPGGCLLPMLIQFPIWIALFRLLSDPICASGTEGCVIKVPAESALYTAIAAGWPEETRPQLTAEQKATVYEAARTSSVDLTPAFDRVAARWTLPNVFKVP